jgi:hypothetical protein
MENHNVSSVLPKQELLYTEIEQLMKAFKGHRCALDFDQGVVHSELKQAKAEEEEEGQLFFVVTECGGSLIAEIRCQVSL